MTSIMMTATELVSPTSSDHHLRKSAFEEKRRMVLALALLPTLGRRAREMSAPRYVREQEEALQHLQTEAEMAEEEARKLEEEIRRMEEDLDDTDDDEDDDEYNELDQEDSDYDESEDEIEEEEEESDNEDDEDDEGEDREEEVEVVVEKDNEEEKVQLENSAEVVLEQQPTPVRKRSRGNSFIKEMLRSRRSTKTDSAQC